MTIPSQIEIEVALIFYSALTVSVNYIQARPRCFKTYFRFLGFITSFFLNASLRIVSTMILLSSFRAFFSTFVIRRSGESTIILDPCRRIFLAALMSRSWLTPHLGQSHCRTLRGNASRTTKMLIQ